MNQFEHLQIMSLLLSFVPLQTVLIPGELMLLLTIWAMIALILHMIPYYCERQ